MGEWRYSSTILDLGTAWRCVVSFTPRSLYSRGKIRRTYWIRDWVGHRADVEAVRKGKIIFPCRELDAGRPAHNLPLYSLSYLGSFSQYM
jgi:hypothetical protein